MDLHPDLAPIAWLLGSWAGQGEGMYPTCDDFSYREEVTWGHGGKPLLAYSSMTWALDDGRPLHSERGYLRVAGGHLELVLAHGSGIVDVSTGSIPSDAFIELRTTSVVSTPTAKEVTSLDRRIWLEDGELRYELDMAAVGQPLSPHLRAVLAKVQ